MPLTGLAAPGYSEIPTGAQAYFDYVNANGGVCGREIEYVVRDDAYNPTNTAQVINQLVLQDEVFAMMGGLGTPTHSAVVDFLNEEEVPDLFVSSGSVVWDEASRSTRTRSAGSPTTPSRARSSASTSPRTSPTPRSACSSRATTSAVTASPALGSSSRTRSSAEETYTPGNTDVGPQIAALQAAGADFVIGFNVPTYTALSQLTALRLNYKPQWFYSNVGSDADARRRAAQPLLRGRRQRRRQPARGLYTTKYIPTVEEHRQPLDPAVPGGLGRARRLTASSPTSASTACRRPTPSDQALRRDLRQPEPRGHRRRRSRSRARVRGPVARAARLHRGVAPRHQRRLRSSRSRATRRGS